MKTKIIFPLCLCSLSLSACGYGLKEVYDGDKYNSSNFVENYFMEWNDFINPYSSNNKINNLQETNEFSLDDVENKVFTHFDDENFKLCETNYESYAYSYDIYEPSNSLKAYGPAIRLANADSSFRYGISSKLFDGQMFCNGHYQISRTQVKPNESNEHNGFGLLFEKECASYSYFMMNFKGSAIENESLSANLPYGTMDMKLHIGFYLKENSGYHYIPVTYIVNDVPTNSGDYYWGVDSGIDARKNNYICFGFDLTTIQKNNQLVDFTRLIGLSLEIEILSTSYALPMDKLLTAMMLYEISLPHSTWY